MDPSLQLFRLLYARPDWLQAPMRFFSNATDYRWFKILLIVMLLGMIARGQRSRRAAVQALIAFPLANEITDFFKSTWPAQRPYQVLHDIASLVGESASSGTASAHSANMAAVAFVFTYHLGWWGVPWIFAAFMTGWSRIYNGDHFPTQVLLGVLVGAFAGFLVTGVWKLIQKRLNPVEQLENAEEVELA